MFEKVNPSHPDKIADRIAGALVDLAYLKQEDPKVAIEILIGHGQCNIYSEASVLYQPTEVQSIVDRIAGEGFHLNLLQIPQDPRLARNQKGKIRCGDNGIFKGSLITPEEKELTCIANSIYKRYPFDGKYILDKDHLIICQSHVDNLQIEYPNATINPLGYWTGGTDVDCGATNRKLGSDMGGSITGGGLHGKDLSKADVSVNIYAFAMAQQTHQDVELCCAIGDEEINGVPYSKIVEFARDYIKRIGGFEKLAEWGLISPYLFE